MSSDPHIKLSQTFIASILEEKNADYTQASDLLSTLSPKSLQNRGLAILNLRIDNIRSGIGDKQIVELSKHSSVINDGNEIIDNIDSIKTGDIVRIDKMSAATADKTKKLKNSSRELDKILDEQNEASVDGVVTKVTAKQINIALNEDSNYSNSNMAKVEDKLMKLFSSDLKIWIVKLSNSITYKRMESTMRKLGEMEIDKVTYLIQLLLGHTNFVSPSTTTLSSSMQNLQFINQNLNESQKNAINYSLNSPITIVHGPFGTGKTSTIIELIKQLLVTKTSKRILVCGPSNISVDTILERLDDFFPDPSKLLRIGHPARLLPQNLKHSLDVISKNSDQGLILKDIMNEIDTNVRSLKKIKRKSEKFEIYKNLNELRKDLRSRSKKSVNELILSSVVVVATLHGSGSRELTSIDADLFDTVIIDEVSQSLEPQCWIPIINHKNVKKLIIAGDTKQLSPTIKIENENSKNFKILNTTLFDRLIKLHNDASFVKFLDTQYRMNDKISKFSSMTLYDNNLQTAKSCFDITLTDLPNVEANDDTSEPLIWYDTQGGDFPERDLSDNATDKLISSKYNEMEALIVLRHVISLIKSGVPEQDIGIISPYNAQVSNLKKMITPRFSHVEISTIDGFQGREKQLIVLSLVRSNFDNNVGFLKNFKRLNVSITRCQRQLCIIGDMEVLAGSRDKFLTELVKFGEDNFEIRYPDLGELLEEFSDLQI